MGMATEFKPGDKIAFLNYEGGGKVVSLMEDEQILIELDEGFEIPVHKSEIVKEKDFIKGEAEPEEKQEAEQPTRNQAPKGEPGLFLAFDQSKGANIRELFVVNNSGYTLFFTIYEQKGEQEFNGLSRGELDSGETQMINRYNVDAFEQWPPLIIQALCFTAKTDQVPAPIYYTFKPRARAFFNAVRTAPLLERSAHLFRIDTNENQVTPSRAEEESQPSVEPEAPSAENAVANIDRPPEVIDLHIDRLVPDYKTLERDKILEYQLSYFESTLDKAMAHEYQKMIFIHGVGNGVLRERIHKMLKKKEGIRSFLEADPQQYGYGATEVRFK